MFLTGDLYCALSAFLIFGCSAGVSITSAEATDTVSPKRKSVTRTHSPSVLIVAAKIVIQGVIVFEESQAPEWTAAQSTLVSSVVPCYRICSRVAGRGPCQSKAVQWEHSWLQLAKGCSGSSPRADYPDGIELCVPVLFVVLQGKKTLNWPAATRKAPWWMRCGVQAAKSQPNAWRWCANRVSSPPRVR